MPEEHDDDQGEENDPPSIEPHDLKMLRQKAKSADDLQKRLAEFERREAFRSAKLDLEDPKTTYFVKGYDGEMTADAIRAAALEAGFLQEEKPQVPADELRQHRRLSEASSGSDSSGSEDLLELINKAKTPEEVMQLMSDRGYPTTWNRPS